MLESFIGPSLAVGNCELPKARKTVSRTKANEGISRNVSPAKRHNTSQGRSTSLNCVLQTRADNLNVKVLLGGVNQMKQLQLMKWTAMECCKPLEKKDQIKKHDKNAHTQFNVYYLFMTIILWHLYVSVFFLCFSVVVFSHRADPRCT